MLSQCSGVPSIAELKKALAAAPEAAEAAVAWADLPEESRMVARRAATLALGAAALGAIYYARWGRHLAAEGGAAAADEAGAAEDGGAAPVEGLASWGASWLPSALSGAAEEREAARALEEESWD